ncbi:MAG: DUF3025 domain-containing protein [Myxococcales bacterium]|nr:MAG: DUF3025 domain-containing protein [Myxococcales bacterium]
MSDWAPALLRAAAAFAPDPAVAWRLAERAQWPAVDDYDALLATRRLGAVCPGLRFVAQAPRPRRRAPGAPPGPGYNESIVAGAVPTRPRSWHDLFNAMIWSALPAAKRAIHHRQRDLIAARGAASGPTARSRREDTLAMIDEGGLVLATRADDAAVVTQAVEAGDQASVDALAGAQAVRAVVCGHALLEHLARAQPARGFPVVVVVERLDDLGAIDDALAHLVPGVGEPGGRPGLRLPPAAGSAWRSPSSD